jgi:hypothetical protein
LKALANDALANAFSVVCLRVFVKPRVGATLGLVNLNRSATLKTLANDALANAFSVACLRLFVEPRVGTTLGWNWLTPLALALLNGNACGVGIT